MSASGLLTNVRAAQSVWGPLNTDSTIQARQTIQKKQRKRKRKECRDMCELENSRKRKSTELLEEQASEVGSSDSKHGAPSDTSVNAKRPKITTLLGTAKPSSLLIDSWEVDSGFSSENSPPASGRNSPCIRMDPSLLVAMDCEMVGTGPNGQCSELARCSILNYSGTVIYDKYIQPCHPVTNYRTRWSGIRKEHLKQALPYEEARNEILEILKGKIIIGHALYNDFNVLGISIPGQSKRDTISSRLLRKLYGGSNQGVSLKKLAHKLLKRNIQVGRAGHCSIEDARAALDLYKLVEDEWEKSLQANIQTLESTDSLEHYMQDQYWPDSMMDCDQ